MNGRDPLLEFERLVLRMRDDTPPAVNVAARVMLRVRAAEVASERTLRFVAVGSCVVTPVVALLGLQVLSNLSSSLEALFEIVPPIGL
ncbi:MAG: hypothetical protein WC655_18030 [Candidatus Hydrogenedentales bacterium]|jgi:hypothetical protein